MLYRSASFLLFQIRELQKTRTVQPFDGEGTVSSLQMLQSSHLITAERDELKQARDEVTKKVDDIYDYLLKDKKLSKKNVNDYFI